MIYHLGNAAYLETYAGHTTSHRLHDGIGQILGKRGKHKDICRTINIGDATVVAHVSQRDGREGQLALQFLTMAAKDGDTGVVAHLGIFVCQLLAGFHKIIHTLVGIGGSLGYEEDDALVGWQDGTGAGFLTIGWTIYSGVDGIGDAYHFLPGEKQTRLRLACQPLAASHKEDVVLPVEILLAVPHLGCQIAPKVSRRQILALRATAVELVAPHGEMAQRGGWPHVVHGPHHGLSALEYLADGTQ